MESRVPRSKKVRGINSISLNMEKLLKFFNLAELTKLMNISKLFFYSIKQLSFFLPFGKMLKKDFSHSLDDLIKNEGRLIKKLKKQYEIANLQDSILIFTGMFLKGFPKNPTRDQNVAFMTETEKKLWNFNYTKTECVEVLPYLSSFLLCYPYYQKIDLSFNELEDKNLISFCKNMQYLKSLKAINLSNNKLKDQSCKALFKSLLENKIINFVDISKNEISAAGLDTLALFIKNTKTLETLNLENNIIGPKGMTLLAEPLRLNRSIKTLNLSYNGITANGTKSLIPVLKDNNKITSLYYGGNYLQADGIATFMTAIKANQNITYLFLDWSHVGKTGAQSVASILTTHYYIITLDLSKNELGDEGLAFIFNAIKKQTSLINLDISGNKITHKSLKIIEEVLKKNGSIGRINLENNELGDTSGKTFKEIFKVNDTITNINLSGIALAKGIVELSEGLKSNASVKIINLSNNKLGKYVQALESLATCIAENKAFVTVMLDDNQIDDKGLAVLVEGIKKNFSVRTFSLKRNYIIDYKLVEDAIRNNKLIYYFELEHNRLEADKYEVIEKALNINKNLSNLKSHLKKTVRKQIGESTTLKTVKEGEDKQQQ
jgi:Ran GTPase-activating protein (RanGAP) involved in mRNA processing and transport